MHETAVIWLRLARRLCRKVNVACWLDRAAVPVVVLAGVAAGGLLLMRHHAPEIGRIWLPVVSAALPLAALLWAWWRARSKFIGIEEALVRLEVRHHLHAALSTARAGMGAWPAAPAASDDGLHWRWGRAGLPPVLAAGLVAAAWLLPVTARPAPPKISQPAAWTVVESDLQTLVEQRVVDEPSTQETREAIESLRERPQSEWFDHSSIEASDRIQLQHQRDVAALEGKMRDVARALREAAAPQAALQPDQGAQQGAEFDKMLEGLRGGGLRPDAELMEKLAEMAGENGGGLNRLDPQQLEEMLKHLEENARLLNEMRDQLQGMPGGMGPEEQGGEGGEGQPGGPNGEGQNGEGQNGEGENGEGQGDNGQGGPSRGPGAGGPLFGDPKNGVDATQRQPLPTGDLSRAAPGDKLGEGETTHKIDENDSPGLRSGGAPVQPGDGGGAVGNDTLHPSEQEALRKFFE